MTEQIPEPTPAYDLVTALGALAEPPKAGKANTGQFAYTYLTLPDLLEAVRSVFRQHGLAVMQAAQRTDDGMLEVLTTIWHTSGQTWTSPPLILPAGRTAQELGSALTYARRYQLATMVGLAGAADDDAAAASAAPKPRSSDNGQQPATSKQLAAIHALATAKGLTADDGRALFTEVARKPVTSSKQLTIRDAAAVIDTLKALPDPPPTLDTPSEALEPPQDDE